MCQVLQLNSTVSTLPLVLRQAAAFAPANLQTRLKAGTIASVCAWYKSPVKVQAGEDSQSHERGFPGGLRKLKRVRQSGVSTNWTVFFHAKELGFLIYECKDRLPTGTKPDAKQDPDMTK